MARETKVSLDVLGTAIRVRAGKRSDYISLTDIAKFKNADHSDDVIRNWLRNRNTIEFLGVWERLNNPGFNPVEFDGIRTEAGLNSFALTPKMWIEATKAIGIESQAVRYGGTFAQKDIAFEPVNGDGLQSVYPAEVGRPFAEAQFRLIGGEVNQVNDVAQEVDRAARSGPPASR